MKYVAIIILVGCIFAGCTADSTSKPLYEGSSSGINFVDATERSGLAFSHEPTRTEEKLFPEIMGSGVAVADFNRDGFPDLLFANSGAVGATKRPVGSENKIFLNDGKGHFKDVTAAWRLPSSGYGQGVAVGDFDNDGLTDLFLTEYEGNNRLIRNTGQGFEDVTEVSGIKSDKKWGTSASFLDFDNDGDLDIYVVNYVDFTVENQHMVFKNRVRVYSTPIYYRPYNDTLWENQGSGKFIDASEKAGITEPGNGLALGVRDIDKDGDVDIYVANDSDANQLWINENGKFKEIAKLAGCAYNEFGKEEGSMGVDFADVDNNGFLDIAVTNFQGESTAIYSQEQSLLFEEISDRIGIGQSARARLSFGIEFFDADNDGDEDLLVANGHIEDNIALRSDLITFEQQNTFYLNDGNGNFKDISDAAGPALAVKQVSRGLAIADLDNDGDLDFVVSNNGGPAQIAFNETKKMGNFAGFSLEGIDSNRSAIGARLVATIGDRKIEQEVMGAQSYLSVSDFRVTFGLGSATIIDKLEIFWPGGEKQELTEIPAGKYYYVRQGSKPTELTAAALKLK